MMEVDTGASVTVIPTAVYEQQLNRVQMAERQVRLQTYSGEALRARGEAVVPVRYENQHADLKFIVVDVDDKPEILGRSWLNEIRLNWGSLFKVSDKPPMSPEESFPQLFQSGVGTLRGHEAQIHVAEGAQPKFHRPRPVPYALRERVDAELDRLQEEGILRPVKESRWAAPIAVVRKSDGNIQFVAIIK